MSWAQFKTLHPQMGLAKFQNSWFAKDILDKEAKTTGSTWAYVSRRVNVDGRTMDDIKANCVFRAFLDETDGHIRWMLTNR